jgi:hypothetical protein
MERASGEEERGGRRQEASGKMDRRPLQRRNGCLELLAERFMDLVFWAPRGLS